MIKQLLFKIWRVVPIPFFLRWFFLWSTNQKFLVGVVAIIFNHQQKVLLLKHTYRDKYPWGLPSGWLKLGEDVDKSIERELFEETGYEVRVLSPLFVGRSKEYPRVDLVFLGELVNDRNFIASDEVSSAQFFSIEELPDLLPIQKELIIRFLGEAR